MGQQFDFDVTILIFIIKELYFVINKNCSISSCALSGRYTVHIIYLYIKTSYHANPLLPNLLHYEL